jgi:hypothetical protein
MFNRMVVLEALKRTFELDNNQGRTPYNYSDNQSSVISQLIYDIFGGEILKTHKKKGWYFYNRINGERIDLTKSRKEKSSGVSQFEDIPSTPDETNNYIEQEEYSTFFIRFVSAFEETVGLKRYPSVHVA